MTDSPSAKGAPTPFDRLYNLEDRSPFLRRLVRGRGALLEFGSYFHRNE